MSHRQLIQSGITLSAEERRSAALDEIVRLSEDMGLYETQVTKTTLAICSDGALLVLQSWPECRILSVARSCVTPPKRKHYS